jgi:OOP family OmpA-OmpF porin
MRSNKVRRAFSVILAFAAALLVCRVTSPHSQQIKGVIEGRSGATMSVQTPGSEKVTVLLTSATQVDEPEGAFRKKHLAMTALVPGLSVEVKGSFNAQNQLVTDTVTFRCSDLKTAQDIQAGLAPTEQQVQQSQQQTQGQQQLIQQQQAQPAAEQKASAEHAAEIAANKAAIEAAKKRFGELGEYNIPGDVTHINTKSTKLQ